MTEDLTPEERAAEEAERTKSSAQKAVADLTRMGIDPRALGLQDAGPPQADRRPGTVPGQDSPEPGLPPGQRHENVVQLRPQLRSDPPLPASGTSAAWAAGPPQLAPVQQAADEPGTMPLELLLKEQPLEGQPKPSPRRLVRAVTFGMLTPDAADAADREREMVNRVRTRQTDHRAIVFLAGKGGVGTTSVALGVGSVLAALRDDMTTVVSLRPGTPSLGLAMAGVVAPTARELTRPDVEVAPLRLSNGLQLVDGPRWGTPVRRQDVPAIVDRLAQDCTFSLFDVGNDASESGHSILSRADQVVIVSSAGPDGVDGARVAAERAAEIDPYLLNSAVYAVVCHRDATLRHVVRRMRETMPGGARVVAVPPEDALVDGGRFDASRVSVATRLAMIDIAGLVALGSVAQRRRP